MKRDIIDFDQEKCNGCALCIPNCPEGAIQIIDGKARLVSDLFCDGLGACIGHCPEGAIMVEKREAEPYDERRVMENIVTQGENVIKAHLEHLREHGEHSYLKQALVFLEERKIEVGVEKSADHDHSGRSGSRTLSFAEERKANSAAAGKIASELTHWPIQLHLVAPNAPHFKGKDVLLSADCVAYAAGDFHGEFLKDKTLTIACPKLDQGQETYIEKLVALIDTTGISSLTVATMEVPCCRGLLNMAQQATAQAKRELPVNWLVVGVAGDILRQEAV